MPANIKEFVIVNNYGNLFTGDNLRDTSFVASKTYSGAIGSTCIDVVTVIGTATNLCLQPGDTVTTTFTRGTTQAGAQIGTQTGTNINAPLSGNTSNIQQPVPNTNSTDSVLGM
ncbi:hypothetical protein CON65_05370 [Bacillus pseudomycoides]|uniref:Uncharacterized protein n=1 Tax=Bacillus pseudomycoides TaxID=64104 RepID=A0AA91VER2_9BACI|nr:MULTISPECIES: hypothetical protein [Bacillus]PEB51686.1 hypothetical protein COO03_15620 [Bacillus sp. AFS098217]PED83654.1 hypothetical protein CON65_05370 [Bacillus pseudomycoides]PEU12358.1 hypothetical protein CN524_13230 [Bacillus sp. AFS019443]PEU21718.1 hypothetical protein CN525_01365 [Bacillus sp. AFS014408]PFW62079.1 hypothetical protein COL20_14605 [Bacillus sp. AFS075034]